MSAPTQVKLIPDSEPPEPEVEHVFDALRAVQEKYSYLPEEQLKVVADRYDKKLREIYAIASYYPHFYLEKPTKTTVRVCDDMTCHLRGAPKLLMKLEENFQDELEKQKSLDISTVSCVGRCDHAPCFTINDRKKDRYYDGHSPDQAIAAVRKTLEGKPPDGSSYRRRKLDLAIDPYNGQRPYSALTRFIESSNWDFLIKELWFAGLRGMGGAGWPTFDKWSRVRSSNAKHKYIVCNADESEPGTIKDRFILTQLPHLVIEGMILAGLCVGAKRGYLYLRHEYQEQEEILREELDNCARRGLLGNQILGTDHSFEIILFISPGGYICGEESAMLEAIEGRRAEPRNKPPFLAQEGLRRMPTVVNNVETLAFVAAIAARSEPPAKPAAEPALAMRPAPPARINICTKGAAWFRSHGEGEFKGLKFVGVTGDVRNPDIFEVPMGTTYRKLIEMAGGLPEGKKLIGFAPSGPSSGYLEAAKADLPLDWETLKKEGSMVGSGAIVVCGSGTCMLDMAFNAVRFYRNESCGKCVPCRLGSQKMVEILERWMRKGFRHSDLALIDELSKTLEKTSICGLGQIVPKPLQSILIRFPEIFKEHVIRGHCPAGKCFHEISK